MRREIHDLVEAVRGLGLRLTGRPSPQCVRIAGDPRDFAERLASVQEALEAADASGALAGPDGPDAPSPADGEADRLRLALDRLLRYVQVKGVDMAEAVDIVAEAMDLDGVGKPQRAYAALPRFGPKGWKRGGGFKPRLKLLPDRPGDASLGDLRRIAFDVQVTATFLGATVAGSPAEEAREERASRL